MAYASTLSFRSYRSYPCIIPDAVAEEPARSPPDANDNGRSPVSSRGLQPVLGRDTARPWRRRPRRHTLRLQRRPSTTIADCWPIMDPSRAPQRWARVALETGRPWADGGLLHSADGAKVQPSACAPARWRHHRSLLHCSRDEYLGVVGERPGPRADSEALDGPHPPSGSLSSPTGLTRTSASAT